MVASCFPLEILQEQQFWTNVVYTDGNSTVYYNLNEPGRGQAGQCCMVTFCEVSNNQVHGVKGKDDG